MKLISTEIENVRGFKKETINFNHNSKDSMVTVILGDNGSGKSTILRSIINNLTCYCPIYGGKFFDLDDINLSSQEMLIKSTYVLNDSEMKQLYGENILEGNILEITTRFFNSDNKLYYSFYNLSGEKVLNEVEALKAAKIREIFNSNSFRGGNIFYFDPFRFLPKEELEGPNSVTLPKDAREKVLNSSVVNNKLVTKFLFIKQWLINLDFKRLKNPSLENDYIFERVTSSFNELFFPYTFEKVNENGEILFRKGDTVLEIDRLSEGFKNIFIIVGEIMFRLNLIDPENINFFENEAIIMIDEIDCHIHPKWQVKIIPYLNKLFPNAQLILTTHSPFIVSNLDEKCIKKLKGDLDE